MKNLKIEVGKYYRTRNGRKVRIYATDTGGNYPVRGVVPFDGGIRIATWTSDGLHMKNSVSDYDIISEWKQTIDDIGFDKSCLPKWAKFICMNEAGQWYWTDMKPKRIGDDLGEYWNVYAQIFGIIPEEHAPKNYQGDWKDSLFEVE